MGLLSPYCVFKLIQGQFKGRREITGGQVALDGSFPFMASIVGLDDSVNIFGGTIITNQWILTAAHCVERFTKNDIFVFAGSSTFGQGAVSTLKFNPIIHEKYEPITVWYDIALLRLAEPFSYSAFIRPVLLRQQPVANRTIGTILGWGTTDDFLGDSHKLRYMHSLIYTCFDETPNGRIYDGCICTSKDAGHCVKRGDSGGPLIVSNKQVGIVSWTSVNSAGERNNFNVHTKVPYFIPWIQKIIAHYR